MKLLKCNNTNRLDLHQVCEMIADGSSLAQMWAKFERSCNVIMIEPLVLKIKNGEMRPDVNRVTINGRKWIASLFHPNLLSEKLICNITHYEASIQDQHLAALKSIFEKRKRPFKEEE